MQTLKKIPSLKQQCLLIQSPLSNLSLTWLSLSESKGFINVINDIVDVTGKNHRLVCILDLCNFKFHNMVSNGIFLMRKFLFQTYSRTLPPFNQIHKCGH